MIDSFRGEFDFLSNFFPSVIEDADGTLWPTAEHAFQAMKTLDPAEREKIRLAPTPGKAKRLGRKVTMREDWEQVKVQVMDDVLFLKFTQNLTLQQKLIATGNQELIEGNNWNDKFWGVCDDEGHNILGLLLMRLRCTLAHGK